MDFSLRISASQLCIRDSHSIDHLTDDLTVDCGLLLHCCDHSQIDLLHGQSIEVGIQQNVQLQQCLIIQFLIHRQDIVLDHITFGNDDRQNLSGIYPGQLDELYLVAM